MKINKKIIKELSDYLEEFNLTELDYTDKDTKIKVSKNNISVNNQNFPSPKTHSKNLNDNLKLKSTYITNILKCVPPEDKPLSNEISNCSNFFNQELINFDQILQVGHLQHKFLLQHHLQLMVHGS